MMTQPSDQLRPPAPQWPRPPHQRPIWPIIATGIAAIALVVAATIFVYARSWNSVPDNASEAPTSAVDYPADPSEQDRGGPQGTPVPGTAAAPAAGIGTAVRDGEIQFTVTGIDDPVSMLGTNPRRTKTARGEFRVVHVTFGNVGAEPVLFSGRVQRLVDDQGHQYGDDTAAELTIEDPSVVMIPQINPGMQVPAVLVYDVPAGTVPAFMELHVAMYSSGAEVALR